METTPTFTIEACNSNNWEPIENAEFNTLAEAEAAMEDLEASLDWRGMRIVDEDRTVWVYGLERDEEDEEDA
ncbi:hypothetical protein [Stenotrophomonas maltophilia]|uniref:hypothetical protein n=1 Tax=Stenotrophomonas maltophilia TaxID=40324 RepID=UPI00209B61F7|nr:hypothetical protein [Stenotrophomonas maltophilia]MCO7473054.1 hypothetical protein [Stenotrophomonas maltophilia]